VFRRLEELSHGGGNGGTLPAGTKFKFKFMVPIINRETTVTGEVVK